MSPPSTKGDAHDPGQDAASATDPVANKTVAEIFGETRWLLTQTPEHRAMTIGELERLVMPGVLLRQFHLQYARTGGANGRDGKPALQPVAVEIWALVGDAGAEPLALKDWQSGPVRRVMLRAALPGLVQAR